MVLFLPSSLPSSARLRVEEHMKELKIRIFSLPKAFAIQSVNNSNFKQFHHNLPFQIHALDDPVLDMSTLFLCGDC